MADVNITPEDITKNKELAALSYLWIFSLIILVARRDSEFVQHHARQGLILFLFSLAFWPLEVTRWGEFVVLALSILGFIEAALGNVYSVPVVGAIADGTFGMHHVKKGVHHVAHTAARFVNPQHVTPAFREELKEQHTELMETEKQVAVEQKLLEKEEKKLSSLLHRIEEDEKEMHRLEDEVHEMEEKVKELVNQK